MVVCSLNTRLTGDILELNHGEFIFLVNGYMSLAKSDRSYCLIYINVLDGQWLDNAMFPSGDSKLRY